MVMFDIAEIFRQNADIVYAILVLLVTILVALIVFILFKKSVMKVDEKVKTSLEHKIVGDVRMPFYLGAILFGIYHSLTALLILEPYKDSIQDAFVIMWVLLTVYASARVVNTLIFWYATKDKRTIRIEKTSLMSLRYLIYIFLLAVAAIIILGELGVEITPLLASLGIGGLAIALALQSTLSNYFAGIYIAGDKTVRLGDFIELENGLKGHVEKTGWRSIWIRTIRNNIVVIPNSKLAESVITNFSEPQQNTAFVVNVGVAYGSDLRKVEKVALKVAKNVMKTVEGGLPEYEPTVRFREFADSNINFTVFLWIQNYAGLYKIRHEFIKQLTEAFRKNKIEISFPCRNLYTRS